MNLTGFYHPIEAAFCLSWVVCWGGHTNSLGKQRWAVYRWTVWVLSATRFPLLRILLVSGATLQDAPKEEQSCLRHLSKTGARLVLAEEFLNSFSFISLLFKPRVLLYKIWQCADIVTAITGWRWHTRSYPVVNCFVLWEIWDLNTHLVCTSLFVLTSLNHFW